MRSLVALAVLGTTLVSSSALAQAPDPSKHYLQSVSYGGTGCPAGSLGNSFSNDRRSFTLIFDSFVASSGPGVPVTESRKNCQLNLNTHAPEGSAQGVFVLDYRGYVSTPSGVDAEQKVTAYFQGEVTQDGGSQAFTGPVSKDYLARYCLVLDTEVDQDGGRVLPLNLNSQVRLFGALSAQAQITTDSIDGRFTDEIPEDCDVLEFCSDADEDGLCDPEPCPDADADGLCDDEDACPNDADNDADGDGVCGDADVCADSVPDQTKNISPGQWAERDLLGTFETKVNGGHQPSHYFTLAETGGCTCQQIADALGLPKGIAKNGCPTSVMTSWIATLTD